MILNVEFYICSGVRALCKPDESRRPPRQIRMNEKFCAEFWISQTLSAQLRLRWAIADQ